MRSTKASRNVSDTIRKAEKHIAGGNLEKAKQLLEQARQNEPNNEYIEAILERVTLLGLREEEPPAETSGAPASTPAIPVAAAVDEVARQVQQLTSMARDLYAHGSVETAFESLMNAYMLDPLSREVVQAEQLILPAVEMMRKRGTVTVQKEAAPPTTAQILRQSVAASGSSPSPMSRLDQLKQQKEHERLLKERAMWRKASEAPRALETEDDPAASAAEPQLVPPSPVKHRDGLLSKLWSGKRLG
jgi:hypothetical protein